VPLNSAIFLDRDGVINKPIILNGKPYAPHTYSEFHLYDDVPKALKALVKAGHKIVLITNQPDIGNGLTEISELKKMHDYLQALFRIDLIQVCPHRQNEGCLCRKPLPGMILEAARSLEIDLSRSWLVGDRVSDIKAGTNAGVRSIFIDRGYFESENNIIEAQVAKNLEEATTLILNASYKSVK